ncbi:hypothetical protein Hanom_Chr11g00983921 [Helianthus anomalus]
MQKSQRTKPTRHSPTGIRQSSLPPEFVRDLTRNCLSGTIPPQWGSMQRIVNM